MASMKLAESSKVRVIVRVRPFLPHESPQQNPCVSVLLDQDCDSAQDVTVFLKDKETSRKECYRLDSFFGEEDNNVSQIFHREVSPLIEGIFQGCNATIFAYGATGSGKTYTMQGSDEQPGLMPLAMSTILSMCQKTGRKAEISYYQVYLDRCYDLLELKAKEIAVWDDKNGQIHLSGLSRVSIASMAEFLDVFSCGVQRRKVAHTALNDVSSRSHGVLVISVSSPSVDGSGDVLIGKLNLIDLAGNEDNRRTCNEGIRLQESSKINQSLFALSNVIYALNNNKARVPYRDSKLTRILQDSLGGKSRALMVACLNPGEYQQSVHTVSLAARSRNISNIVPSTKQETPNIKVNMEEKLRAWLESKGKSKSANKFGALNSPFMGKNSTSVKKPSFCNSSLKAKVATKRGAYNENDRERNTAVPFTNLFDEDLQEYWSKTLKEENLKNDSIPIRGDEKEEREEGAHGIVTESSNKHLPGEPLNQDKSPATVVASSPVSGKKNTLRSPLRNVLFPINTNISQNNAKEFSFTEKPCDLFEPSTPKTPSIFTCTNTRLQKIATPLDKLNSRGSNLKDFLAQEYVHFLNTASRDELLELKGIGVKIAEYILELRETSPVKSLNDLEKIGLSSKQVIFTLCTTCVLDPYYYSIEKIGLSSKQVRNLFSRATRAIFETENYNY
ncbi:kinesin-like protein KIN-10B isoform X1 [Cannabis sativa]|uniref:kinesin-like protein KIN-10B isoform X1 n=1 Tax=Cannabis sativa TaxID=3483 RepID=UPI0029CA0508|nr:kinesin-like protein KIN-10B isoform X1 [Cannabis sativa]